ncbi:MAG: metallophosphoesterase [Streptococcaceae bacterium]|jgi:3',5'-cyclic AMP phosphodiesterase CpdA|nr:metallophosphoesterase [Streptococcaceae bacterium]
MKKKIAFVSLILLFLIVFILIIHQKLPQSKENYITKTTHSAIWVISDTHFISKKLYDNNSAFEKMKKTSAGKELTYQEESLEALVQKALQEKPQAIVLTGDITFNGEKQSAQDFMKIFLPLKKANIPLLAIPGNHDINNGYARGFEGSHQYRTPEISQEEFREIFSDGFTLGNSFDKKTLSYRVDWNKGYQFLFLDTNNYPSAHSLLPPQTNGVLEKETIDWIKEQLQHAKEKKQTTIVFMHHNLYAHALNFSKGFVLDNAEQLQQILTKNHVPLVFSGHIHMQDILTHANGPTEILTGAYSVYELTYGVVNLDKQAIEYQKKLINVNDWARKKKLTNPDLLDYTSYQAKTFETSHTRDFTQKLNIYDEVSNQEIESLNKFMNQLNIRLFTGNDLYTKQQKEEILNSREFRLIKDFLPEQKAYVEGLLLDEDSDQSCNINLKGPNF